MPSIRVKKSKNATFAEDVEDKYASPASYTAINSDQQVPSESTASTSINGTTRASAAESTLTRASNASGLGFTRMSFADTGGPKQDGFATAAVEARGEDRVRETVRDMKSTLCSLQGGFLICATATYITMIIFAAISMHIFDDCQVYNTEGRCCSCLTINVTRMINQQMPRKEAWNNIFYSLLFLINASFAFFYSVIAVKRENKYQIVCSLVAQATSVIRAGVDIVLEKREFATEHAIVRISLVSVALVFVIIATTLTPKLFRKFGWVIFKRSAGNPKQRRAYSLYQLYRSFNWLEIQSATVLLCGIGSYLGFMQHFKWLPFCLVCVLEFISARQVIHHLKRDNLRTGVGISIVSKIFVLAYCILVVVDYFDCRTRFLHSLKESAKFWEMNPYPDLDSVMTTYNGQECLGARIVHDDRVAEALAVNISFLVIWRVSSLINLFQIFKTTEGGGLKSLFYKKISKKRKKKSTASTRKPLEDRLTRGGGGDEEDDDARRAGRRNNDHNDNDDDAASKSSQIFSMSSQFEEDPENEGSRKFISRQQQNNKKRGIISGKNASTLNRDENDDDDDDDVRNDGAVAVPPPPPVSKTAVRLFMKQKEEEQKAAPSAAAAKHQVYSSSDDAGSSGDEDEDEDYGW